MKTILVMVTSLNGKITRGDHSNIYQWTSKEDQEYFLKLKQKYRAFVMGSNTYEASKKRMKLKKDQLRIVLTKHPKKYRNEVVPGQLEFSNETPQDLINRLKKQEVKKVLLLGGGKINSSFLKENLFDELYLTLEPKIFGIGKSIFDEGEFESSLQLLSVKRLNKRGTLLLKYRRIK